MCARAARPRPEGHIGRFSQLGRLLARHRRSVRARSQRFGAATRERREQHHVRQRISAQPLPRDLCQRGGVQVLDLLGRSQLLFRGGEATA
ncbi:hypothetical protein [Spongiactinospora sp. 9N601]|uniref:hypothetical protein n=1 Tax=Spongiactinospora sp. 9N601 TaxID=3375149 RepID=UPI00378E8A40